MEKQDKRDILKRVTKVLFVYTHTVHGGGEVLLLRIVKGVDKKKIHPFLAISARNDRLAAELRAADISYVTLSDINLLWENKLLKVLVQLPNFIFLNVKIARLIAKEKPDVVHAGMFYSALFSILPAKFFGKPFTWAALTPTDLFRYKFFSKTLMRLSDKTMLPCKDFVRLAKEAKMPGTEKMEVVYTGLREDEFRERPGGDTFDFNTYHIARPIVALVARYDEVQKGHKYFWEMAHRIHEKMPQVNFVVAGGVFNPVEAEFKERLERLSKDTGIQDNVFCVGLVRDIPDFLSYVDVVVIPSVYEAPSAVAQEAGAAGKPVVAFRVGGIPEVLHDGEGGFLVPFADVDALTERTISLLADPRLARTMGAKGKRFVQENFNERTFIASYERVYGSLAKK